MRRGLVAATLLTLLIVWAALLPTVSAQQRPSFSSFDSEVGRLVGELSLIRSRGVNVTKYVNELNRAVSLYESGNSSEAYAIVDNLSNEIPGLLRLSEKVHMHILIKRYTAVGLLLVTPVLVYLLLPRAYLYLWYASRRNWIVEGERSDNG